MKFDIFFISYTESNCEENWAVCKQLEPAAKRIHGISGIDAIHKICDAAAQTEFFYTIDGDNKLTSSLSELDIKPQVDLLIFFAKDPIYQMPGGYGGIKLWRKGAMRGDMSKGDFSLNSTETIGLYRQCMSDHAYTSSPWDAWKSAFRQVVKAYMFGDDQRPLPWFDPSKIPARQKDSKARAYLTARDTGIENAEWVSLGAEAALEFIKGGGDRHIINNYTELRKIFDAKYH